MKQIFFLLVIGSVFCYLGSFCTKAPDYPDEPVIAFGYVTPTTILQQPFFANPDTVFTSLIFTFTDGDGNLGFESNDSTSMELRDTRSPQLAINYRLPLVDSQGSGNGISGEITVRVPVSCCIPDPVGGIQLPPCKIDSPSGQLRDTVIYSIKIRDRAGNWSNTIQSAPIVLICKQ